eukprot:scaffold693_cov399-Prasinococcus_capsulatus_cf.AAC.25
MGTAALPAPRAPREVGSAAKVDSPLSCWLRVLEPSLVLAPGLPPLRYPPPPRGGRARLEPPTGCQRGWTGSVAALLPPPPWPDGALTGLPLASRRRHEQRTREQPRPGPRPLATAPAGQPITARCQTRPSFASDCRALSRAVVG